MQETVICPNCGLQTAGQQFCTNCGTKLPGGTQQQASEAQPAPDVPMATTGTPSAATGGPTLATGRRPRQKYVLLGAAGIIFRIIGWVVLVGGMLGSVALTVMAGRGGMPELITLLDRGMAIMGVSGVPGIGLAVMVFGGILGSLLCGLGLLAFGEICNAVTAIEETTRAREQG